MATVFIVVIILSNILACRSFNWLGCEKYKPWEVDYENNDHDAAVFQEWLHAYQHNGERCKMPEDEEIKCYGLSNCFLRALVALQRSIESNKIYRPKSNFKWAANVKNCTLNRPMIDCYSKELSSCGITVDFSVQAEPMTKDESSTELGKKLVGRPHDICNLGIVTKKSIAWVVGQYENYLLRMPNGISEKVNQRIKGIFSDLDPSRQSTIAVHYRAGRPDYNRRVLPLSVFMDYVKQFEFKLAAEGRPVGAVYLASQDNINVFHSQEWLKEHYGDHYKILPTISSGLNTSNEIEYEIEKHPDVNLENLYIEYLADVILMTQADVYIGSVSTMYQSVNVLRYANYPKRKQTSTCYVDTEEELICEDNPKKYELFSKHEFWFIGDRKDGESVYGSFIGGTPF